MKLVGYSIVNYVSKRSGLPVHGYNLYVVDPLKSGNENGCGFGSRVLTTRNGVPYISDLVAAACNLSPDRLNHDVVLYWNEYGNVSKVEFP